MKKYVILTALLILGFALMGQDWISDGEGMLSVRTKLNNLKMSVDTLNDNMQDTAYAKMYTYDGYDVDTILIDEKETYNLITGMATNLCKNWVYNIGDTGVIQQMATGGTGLTIITDTAHGLRDVSIISISGTADYNGIYAIDSVDANNFKIIHSFISNQLGYWSYGSNLESEDDGTYLISFSVSGRALSTAVLFGFKIFVGTSEKDGLQADQYFVGSTIENLGASDIINISFGDPVSIGCANKTNATDFLISHINVNLIKIR